MVDGTSEALVKARAAHAASRTLALCPADQRERALRRMAVALVERTDEVLEANRLDVESARAAGTTEIMLDRLSLDASRLVGMADALREIADQDDPIGEVVEERTIDAGLLLRRVRVPLGVVAIVYEARPNVTSDAVGLCIRSADAVILRGGSSAQRSNLAIVGILAEAALAEGLPDSCIQYIEDTSHAATEELMGLRGLVDVLIPRGGAGLIRSCVDNAKVPVIETGTGNCHVYLHSAADPAKAVAIAVNAKTSRPSVCNAAESLLVDRTAAAALLPPVLSALADAGVTLHCDETSLAIARGNGIASVVPADGEDWGREYLSLDMSVATVADIDEAVEHIATYGTGHSECIVSEDAAACERFLDRVDAAAVYANASTRFTDGGVFGLGAEIGISTQKLHVRGPMGASALCTTKYRLTGDGQVR